MSTGETTTADGTDGAGANGAGDAGTDGTDPSATPDASEATEEETDQWTKSRLGVFVIVIDLLLLGLLVVGSLGLLTDGATIEPYVYVFAALGALGYVFTGLVQDYRRETAELLHMNLRIPAALPLAVGLYLLAGQFLGEDPSTRLIAGLAFLTGLFVNIAYERIGALAKRLLPVQKDDADESAERDTNAVSGDGVGDGTTPSDT